MLHKATAMVAHTAIEEASKRVVKSREAILSKKPGAENRRKINRRYSTFETHRMRMDQSYGRADLCEVRPSLHCYYTPAISCNIYSYVCDIYIYICVYVYLCLARG